MRRMCTFVDVLLIPKYCTLVRALSEEWLVSRTRLYAAISCNCNLVIWTQKVGAYFQLEFYPAWNCSWKGVSISVELFVKQYLLKPWTCAQFSWFILKEECVGIYRSFFTKTFVLETTRLAQNNYVDRKSSKPDLLAMILTSCVVRFLFYFSCGSSFLVFLFHIFLRLSPNINSDTSKNSEEKEANDPICP